MTHIAAAFLLAAFLIIYSYTGSFDLSGDPSVIPPQIRNLLFVLFLIGFGTKAGVIPVHIWLPRAHPAAPSNVSALMSGIMLKTAIYGMIRFIADYLCVSQVWWGVVLLCIGVISAVLGVAYAMIEHNAKRLLAFSSVENIGIILIGLGVFFIAQAQGNETLAAMALAASLLHSFNHTLFKGGMFLGAGAIQYATHTKDIEKLGGLIKTMPVTAFLVLCFSLAISSIVPFNGFISEWLTFQSLFANITPGQSGLNILSILAAAALGTGGRAGRGLLCQAFRHRFSRKAAHGVCIPGNRSSGPDARRYGVSRGALSALRTVSQNAPAADRPRRQRHCGYFRIRKPAGRCRVRILPACNRERQYSAGPVSDRSYRRYSGGAPCSASNRRRIQRAQIRHVGLRLYRPHTQNAVQCPPVSPSRSRSLFAFCTGLREREPSRDTCPTTPRQSSIRHPPSPSLKIASIGRWRKQSRIFRGGSNIPSQTGSTPRVSRVYFRRCCDPADLQQACLSGTEDVNR